MTTNGEPRFDTTPAQSVWHQRDAQEGDPAPGNSFASTAVPLAVVSRRSSRSGAYWSLSYQLLNACSDGNRSTTVWPGPAPSSGRVLPEATITSPPAAASI